MSTFGVRGGVKVVDVNLESQRLDILTRRFDIWGPGLTSLSQRLDIQGPGLTFLGPGLTFLRGKTSRVGVAPVMVPGMSTPMDADMGRFGHEPA